jgi:hypothetical protein
MIEYLIIILLVLGIVKLGTSILHDCFVIYLRAVEVQVKKAERKTLK